MENTEKGLTVPKWVLIVQLKIPQMPPKCLAQFVCPRSKVWDLNKCKIKVWHYEKWVGRLASFPPRRSVDKEFGRIVK